MGCHFLLQECEPKRGWKLAESVIGRITREVVATRVKCPIAEGPRAEHLCWALNESQLDLRGIMGEVRTLRKTKKAE